MTTDHDLDLSYAQLIAEVDETKQWGMAQDIINDRPLAYVAQDPRSAVDPMVLKNLFYSEDWVYIVVDRIASKISSQWLRVMREEVVDGKKIVKPAESHPLQTLLETPNQEQDYHSFMYAVIVDECLMGNAMVWYAKQLDQLVLLPAEITQLDVGADGTLNGYKVTFSQGLTALPKKILRFDPEEICHIRRPNPSGRLYGLSPFIPGRRSVNFNKFTSDYLNNFYEKGAQPGLLLEMRDVPNQAEAIRLIKQFEQAYGGRQNQWKMAVVPKGVVVNQMTHSLADQQLIEYVRANREVIMNLLQIPKHELSLAEAGSLGSQEYKTALKNFWSGQLRSIMRRVAGSFSRFFANQLGDGYFFEFDLSDVDVLQEDQDQKAALAEKLLATHTVNEVRAKLYDLQPVPQGDGVRGTTPMGMPMLPPPAGTAGAPPTTMELLADVEKGLLTRDEAAAKLTSLYGFSSELADKILGPDDRLRSEMIAKNKARFALLEKAVGDWFERTDRALQDSFDSAVPKLLARALKLLVAQLDTAVSLLLDGEKGLKAYRTKADTVDPKAFKKALRAALDDLEAQYLDGYSDELKAQMETGYDSTIAVSFNQADQARIEAIRARTAKGRYALLEERGLKTFAWLSETTTDQIMGVIERGIGEKWAIEDIARAIAKDPQFSEIPNIEKRAMVIARTEVLHAASVGQAAAMNDAARVVGKLQKMWVNAGDERVRGNPDGKYSKSKYDHWNLQGETVDADQPFPNGLMYPRDPRGKAGDVIQCRCRVVAVAAEDAEAIGFGDLDREQTSGGNP